MGWMVVYTAVYTVYNWVTKISNLKFFLQWSLKKIFFSRFFFRWQPIILEVAQVCSELRYPKRTRALLEFQHIHNSSFDSDNECTIGLSKLDKLVLDYYELVIPDCYDLLSSRLAYLILSIVNSVHWTPCNRYLNYILNWICSSIVLSIVVLLT